MSQQTNSSKRIESNGGDSLKNNLLNKQQLRNGHVHSTGNNNLHNIIPTESHTTLMPLIKNQLKYNHSNQSVPYQTTDCCSKPTFTLEDIRIKHEPIMEKLDDYHHVAELATNDEIRAKSEVVMKTRNDDHSQSNREEFLSAKNSMSKRSHSDSDQPSGVEIKLTIKQENEEEIRSECQPRIEASKTTNDGVNYKLNENSRPQIRLTPTSKLLAPMAVPKVPVICNANATTKKKYPCPYENCTKSYGKSSHLRSHLTWHTGIKPFVCKEPSCGKGFTRSDELNRHIRTHTGEKPFECIQCTKKFSRSDHLTKHLATHAKHRSAVLGNNVNNRKLKSEKAAVVTPGMMMMPTASNECQLLNLKKHLSYVDSMQFVADLVEDLKKRQTTTSENQSDESSLLTKRPIKIKLERQDESSEYHIVPTVTKPADYKKPKQNLHYTGSTLEEETNDTKATAGAFVKAAVVTSNNCSSSFPSTIFANELKSEHYANNLHDEEPDDDAIMPEANLPPYRQSPHLVPALNGNFVNSAGSTATLRYHYPGRPFKCIWCLKFFKRQDDLNRHMRVHTGEKPFICNECNKGFKRSDHLKKHMNTHTRIR